DYFATGKLDPKVFEEVVEGMTGACREAGCALLGGETAEMPGFYQPGDYELVGFIVGLVDRPHLLDGSRAVAGSVLVGLAAGGLHTNGYSLARRILFDQLGLRIDDRAPWAKRQRVGEELLAPHLSYLAPLGPLLRHPALRAMAHVTGGGLTDNLPRVLAAGTHAEIRFGSWEVPEIFHFLQEQGGVETEEMLRVFNMGIGMVLVVDPAGLREVLRQLRQAGQRAWTIGTVQAGGSGVVYDLGPLPGEPLPGDGSDPGAGQEPGAAATSTDGGA
ncbi:MAG: phosphoribosylformylglycinamidine cyclo-ligase, partial [Acidobacteria bacterium]|nr:phosphoribosylformylglycinamidine cyclo-ligase [Acidobacteriota bacterium]